MAEYQREFQILFENMAQGAFVQNPDGRLCDVNQAALDLFGLSRDEFLGRTSYNVEWQVIKENGQPLPPQDHPSMLALITGQPVRGAVAGVYNPRRRAYVWMVINAIPLIHEGQTKPYQVFVTLHDITERKLMEEELRERMADLAEAQRVACFGNWRFNLVTGEVRWSEELYRIFDIDQVDFGSTYDSFINLVHPDDRPVVVQANSRARETGEPFEIEYRVITRSGALRHIREVGKGIKDQDGRIVGLFGVAQDITAQKLVEKRIIRYQERLRALTEEISSVEEEERRRIAGLLHDEIGQVLALIKMNLGSLSATEPSAERKGQIDSILRQLHDAIAFVRSLTSELVPVILYEVGLEAAVESICEELRQRHGVKVEYRASGPKIPFHDKQFFLFKCIREVVYNALKHAQASTIRISLLTEEDWLRVVVEDDGIGFHEKQEPEHNGSFGLFSIKERLGNIGGRIIIGSTPGHGASVTLVFPLPQDRTDGDGETTNAPCSK